MFRAAWLLLTVLPTQAVPLFLTYSGELTDAQGTPYAGTVSLRVELIDTLGAVVWSEPPAGSSAMSVPVTRGFFTVTLGTTPGSELSAGLLNQPDLRLRVTLDGDVLDPPMPVHSVPYALVADEARTLQGLVPSDLVTPSQLADGSAPVAWGNLTGRPADLDDGDDDTRPGVDCGGDLLTWNGAAFVCVPDVDTLPGMTCNAGSALTWDGAQFGCVDILALVGPPYTDAQAVAAMGAKANANPLHHDRYSDIEAIAAMGAKGNTNPLHHDRYTDAEAQAACFDTEAELVAALDDNYVQNQSGGVQAASALLSGPVTLRAAAPSLRLESTEGSGTAYLRSIDGASTGHLPGLEFRSEGVAAFGGYLVGRLPDAADQADAGVSAALVIEGRRDGGALQNAPVLKIRNGGTPLVTVDATGNMGLGTTTPPTRLSVNGGVQVGGEAATCDASLAGTLSWTGSALVVCDGQGWAMLHLAAAESTCLAIKTNSPSSPDGLYWIDPNGGSSTDAFQAYCDMTANGGGWTLVARQINTTAAATLENSGPVATLTDPNQATAAKLTDAVINQIAAAGNSTFLQNCAGRLNWYQLSQPFASDTANIGNPVLISVDGSAYFSVNPAYTNCSTGLHGCDCSTGGCWGHNAGRNPGALYGARVGFIATPNGCLYSDNTAGAATWTSGSGTTWVR